MRNIAQLLPFLNKSERGQIVWALKWRHQDGNTYYRDLWPRHPQNIRPDQLMWAPLDHVLAALEASAKDWKPFANGANWAQPRPLLAKIKALENGTEYVEGPIQVLQE